MKKVIQRMYVVEYRVYSGHCKKIKVLADSHEKAKSQAEYRLPKDCTVLSTEVA